MYFYFTESDSEMDHFIFFQHSRCVDIGAGDFTFAISEPGKSPLSFKVILDQF